MKARAQIGLAGVTAAFLGLAGWAATSQAPAADADIKPPASTSAPATARADMNLAGMKFVSKDKQEVGRGVGGPAMGVWRLTFTGNRVSWRYSDVVESLTYTITEDGKITATSAMRTRGPKIEGQYFPEKRELLWDKVWYKAE